MLLKNITTFVFVLAVILAPCVAAAALTVSISDGTTTITGTSSTPGTGKFVLFLSQLNPIPSTTTLFLLQNCTAPCSVGFPSGSSPFVSTDTLVLADLTSTSRASVVVNKQSSTATMTLTNLKVTSRVSGKILTMTYATASGDLGSVTTGGTYPANIAVSGTFRNSFGAQASACSSGVSSPCAQSTLKVNGVTVAGSGSGSSTLVTATVPCSGFASTSPAPPVPCSPTASPGGLYTSTTGSFTGVSDAGQISCGSPCSATQTGTLMAKFSGSNETLTLSGSNAAATSFLPVENPNSLTGVFTALQGELGANFFVAYTPANGQYQVSPNPPLTNQTRNINNSSNMVLSFYLLRALLQNSANVSLVSIGCDNSGADVSCVPSGSAPLPPSATSSNDAAYITFIPSTLAFKDLTILKLFYDQFVGTAFSGDPRLGDVSFSDCSSGSHRVDITLADPKTNAVVGTGPVHVYLGSNEADNFRSNCAEATLSGSNLPDDRDARVDTSGIGGSCCETFKSAQTGTEGKFIVKAITWIVDQGVGTGFPTFENYKVDTQNMVVNASNALNSLVSLGTPQQVGSSELPQDGTFMRITKLSTVSDPGNCTGLAGDPCPTIVDVVPSSAISTSGNKFSASVNVNDLLPVAGGTTYAVEMCLFGGTTLTGPASPSQADLLSYFKSFQGTCPATVGIMTLQ